MCQNISGIIKVCFTFLQCQQSSNSSCANSSSKGSMHGEKKKDLLCKYHGKYGHFTEAIHFFIYTIDKLKCDTTTREFLPYCSEHICLHVIVCQ